jgi:hypothetical protein
VVPDHSTFSVNRIDHFCESDILRRVFQRGVAACMAEGLVRGEGFAVDASVMEAMPVAMTANCPINFAGADAQRQKRAVAECLAGLEAEAGSPAEDGGKDRGDGSDGERHFRPDRKPPKVISPSDPSSAWRRYVETAAWLTPCRIKPFTSEVSSMPKLERRIASFIRLSRAVGRSTRPLEILMGIKNP